LLLDVSSQPNRCVAVGAQFLNDFMTFATQLIAEMDWVKLTRLILVNVFKLPRDWAEIAKIRKEYKSTTRNLPLPLSLSLDIWIHVHRRTSASPPIVINRSPSIEMNGSLFFFGPRAFATFLGSSLNISRDALLLICFFFLRDWGLY
jgi:hypothetical protein